MQSRNQRATRNGGGCRDEWTCERQEREGGGAVGVWRRWRGLLLLLLCLRLGVSCRKSLDDVVNTLGLEHDLRPVAARLACEL